MDVSDGLAKDLGPDPEGSEPALYQAALPLRGNRPRVRRFATARTTSSCSA